MQGIFRNTVIRVLILSAGMIFSGALCTGSFAERKLTYVGQNVIDSLVDRALYILNSAGDPASGMSQEEAVASAKKIVVKLRNIAAYDQNQKYILSKTGDLENQIYLEEEGLLMEKEKFRQKSVNELVPFFNAELGKKRPDFKELWGIQKQVAGIDANMAIDVENSIRKRAFALAKEVPFLLEANLEDGKIDSARFELAYCRVNSSYLGMSPTRVASLEARMNSKVTSDDERQQVIKGLERFKAALKTNNLQNARIENQFLGTRIKALRNNIQSYEWVRLNKDYELFTSKYERKTDSLCDIAIGLLRSRGPYVASAFLDTMRKIGLTIEKVNKVDQMILESVVAEKQRAGMAAAESAPAGEFSVDTATGKNNPVLNDLLATARKRAEQKKDSQALARKDRSATTQIEEVRKDRLRTAYHLQEMRERDSRKTDTAVALQKLGDIYTSIEKGKPKDAQLQFKKSEGLLKKNLPEEDFAKVAMVVNGKK